ncbi:MAG: ribosomal-processing cysteine protease Prp [Oscillospiraceae bacterium]|nr:ribosomal-processing cysteine protease Prp [Oscillospiraceae bacterium]
MIRIRCGEGRVTLLGHAGYAAKGQDVVCAAASALIYALIGTLRQKKQLHELVIRPGYVTVAAEGDCEDVFAVVRCGLGQLAGAYPAYVAME